MAACSEVHQAVGLQAHPRLTVVKVEDHALRGKNAARLFDLLHLLQRRGLGRHSYLYADLRDRR